MLVIADAPQKSLLRHQPESDRKDVSIMVIRGDRDSRTRTSHLLAPSHDFGRSQAGAPRLGVTLASHRARGQCDRLGTCADRLLPRRVLGALRRCSSGSGRLGWPAACKLRCGGALRPLHTLSWATDGAWFAFIDQAAVLRRQHAAAHFRATASSLVGTGGVGEQIRLRRAECPLSG